MTRLVPVLLVLSLVACTKKHDDEQTRKLAGLCTEAGDLLKRDASSADVDTFKSLLSSALEACSQACDGNDQPSCKHLDDHLGILCKTMSSACDSLCDTASSPSLKSTSCRLKSGKVKT